MIWVLLGLLLFGGGALLDMSRPQARAQVILENVDGVVADPARREAAHTIAERVAAEAEVSREVIETFERRLRELDGAETLDEAACFAAVDAVSDAIDASELRMLEGRTQLRAAVTADEWTKLMKLVHPADDD